MFSSVHDLVILAVLDEDVEETLINVNIVDKEKVRFCTYRWICR